MSRVLTCDHCQETIDGEPFELIYPVVENDDDEDDDVCDSAEFCSLACLTNWAMAQALDHGSED
jgi:MinD superfamily P-loop ATPase